MMETAPLIAVRNASVLFYDSKIIMLVVYFDDISLVYILSADIFRLHLLEMINKS